MPTAIAVALMSLLGVLSGQQNTRAMSEAQLNQTMMLAVMGSKDPMQALLMIMLMKGNLFGSSSASTPASIGGVPLNSMGSNGYPFGIFTGFK